MTEGAAPMRTNASGPKLAFAYAVELAKSTAPLREAREPHPWMSSEGEYDAGHWTRSSGEAVVEADTKAFGTGCSRGSETIGLFKIDGRMSRPRRPTTTRMRSGSRRLVSPVVGEAHEVVELVFGFGMNLFTLAAQRPALPVPGLRHRRDGALAAAREIAEHFGIADRFAFSRST